MGKKKATFKNIMVTLGCTAFAGVYVLGGSYAVSTLLGSRSSARPAWLERVEIHVEDSAVAAASGRGGVSNTRSGGSDNFGFNSDDALQKPRFDEKETETEIETEIETETDEMESESEEEDDQKTDAKSEKAREKETETDEAQTDEAEADERASEEAKKKDEESDQKGAVEVRHVEVLQQDDQALAVMADVTAVVRTAMPCVVSITNEYTAYDYWYDEEYDEQANGSGIVVAQTDEELLIVTNYHVVENNNSLYVQFIDDAEAVAYVKGTSPENDLAIVSVFLEEMGDDTLASIAIAALGDSDSLQVGEPAIAIGDSLGYGQSVTTGVISALNRNVFADEEDKNPSYLIQTDAAINPGNSGGALLNVRGEVVGINSSKIADYVIEGMGYAIPISAARPIIEDLMQRETRKKVPEEARAFLGITGTDVIEEATARYEMPEGVYVNNVLEDTAADEAGILKGDILMYLDGEKITRMDELQGLLEFYEAGTEVEVVLMRQSNGEYKERTIDVTLGYKEQ